MEVCPPAVWRSEVRGQGNMDLAVLLSRSLSSPLNNPVPTEAPGRPARWAHGAKQTPGHEAHSRGREACKHIGLCAAGAGGGGPLLVQNWRNIYKVDELSSHKEVSNRLQRAETVQVTFSNYNVTELKLRF